MRQTPTTIPSPNASTVQVIRELGKKERTRALRSPHLTLRAVRRLSGEDLGRPPRSTSKKN